MKDKEEAQLKLLEFDEVVATRLPRSCSADAYLYWEAHQLQVGVTMFEISEPESPSPMPVPLPATWSLRNVAFKAMDGVALFDTEMYVSGMHGCHGGGKTSSFKRCIFLTRIGVPKVASRLVAAVEARPSLLCYLHLLQGGGAIADVAGDATAFGCRDWEFACVITGVWGRDDDGTAVARSAVEWVYSVAGDLLPVSSGAYGAVTEGEEKETNKLVLTKRLY